MLASSKTQVPLQEGLVALGADGKHHLLANKCVDCGLVFFPKRKYCAKCSSPDLPNVTLSDRGKVFTFSLINRKSKYTIVEPPYVEAEVQMPEGIRLYTVLDQCSPEAVQVGMEVEVYVDKVSEDKKGNDVVAYKFRPVAVSNNSLKGPKQ